MTRVAIIEHDLDFAEDLRKTIASAGLQTDCFAESAAALPEVRSQVFALLILGLDIRDADPFAVCREVSAIVPVIAVSIKRDEEACLRALHAGADDCIARPFSARELQARTFNLLRRAGRSDDAGELGVAVSAMRVRTGGEMRYLSRGEAEILSLLVASQGAPLTVLQMIERLPQRTRVKRGTVESRIKSLRRKLGPHRLVSRGRFGYQLVGE